MPDQFEQYYKYLKDNGADVAPDFNSFKNTLSNYDNASKYYSYLKDNDFDVPATYDSFADTFGLKKKDGGIVSSPIPSKLPSKGVLEQGQEMATVGFEMPQSQIGRAVEKDKKVDGSTLAGLYNTLVGSVSSLAGGTAYMADVLSAPIGLPLNVRVANAQSDRKKVVDFVEKARSSASTPKFEQQQGEFDFSNGVDLQDIKGLAFQAPRTLVDMGIGALTGGSSYFAQAVSNGQKELEETGNADKLSDTQKVGYLFIQGSVQAALEKIGLDKVLKHTGLTKKVGQKIAKEVVDEMVEKGVKATAKDIENLVLNKATKLSSKIKNVGLNAGKSFVAEGSTEGLQQAASDITKTITNKIAGNDIFNQEDINSNFWKNVVNAGIAGGAMGGVVGGGVGTLSNTNKAIRRQIAEVQSPQDLSNLQTQINEQIELGNITPEEAQAANIKAQQYAEIAAKIPTQVSQEDKYKIIGGIDQRNQLKDAMQQATDEMSNIDESFRKQKEDEIGLMQAKINQVNDYIDGIVAGKEYDYKENKGEFFKIDPNGNEIKITKDDYDIAKAVQEENRRKEAEQTAIRVEMPSVEQQAKESAEGNIVTFTYKSEEEVPDAFKDRISSTGENTLPDGTVEQIVRVTVPKSVADYELAKTQQVAPTEAKTVEQLRAEEQAEYDSMTDPNDEVKKKEIYDKYDKLITPLLEKQEVQPAEVKKERAASVEPELPEGGLTIVTETGLTEDERRGEIEKRKSSSQVSDETLERNSIIRALALLFPKNNKGKIIGARERNTSEAIRKINELKLRANKLGLSINTQTGSLVKKFKKMVLGKETTRTRKIAYDNKADSDMSIDESGKTLYERDSQVQSVFKELIDNGHYLDFKDENGVRYSASQLDATIKDILDGIPSKRANRYLDEVETSIKNDEFFIYDKALGEFNPTYQDLMGLEKENIGEPMTEEEFDKYLNDESNLTPEEEEQLTDNVENLLNEYENEQPETGFEGEVQQSEQKTEKGVPSEVEQTAKPTSKLQETKGTLAEEYESIPKGNKLSTKNAIKALINDNFEEIKKQLENKKICQ